MTTIKKASAQLLLIFAISVSAQNQSFEVTEKGNGQPILFSPGFASTGEVWDATVAELSRNHECHIFTVAGFGGVAPVEKPWLPKITKGTEDCFREQFKNLKDYQVEYIDKTTHFIMYDRPEWSSEAIKTHL